MKLNLLLAISTLLIATTVRANAPLPGFDFPEFIVQYCVDDLVKLENLKPRNDATADAARQEIEKRIANRLKDVTVQWLPFVKNQIAKSEKALSVRLKSITPQSEVDPIQQYLNACKALRDRLPPDPAPTGKKTSSAATPLAALALSLAFASAGLLHSRTNRGEKKR